MEEENHISEERHEEPREKPENHSESHSEDHIKIKKDDLWKYSTFVLVAVVVIGGLLMLSGGESGTGSAVAPTNNVIDISVFLNNPDIYPSIGPEDAENVVIEFSDFQCSYCTLATGIPAWTEDYKAQFGDLVGVAEEVRNAAERGELRFIYVSWSFLGDESFNAAEAALCANEQGKFWEMHDAIFEASTGPEKDTGKYSRENLKVLAAGVDGLDTTAFNSCLDSEEYASAIQRVNSDARATGLQGTPAFLVNGVDVSPSWSAIQAALN